MPKFSSIFLMAFAGAAAATAMARLRKKEDAKRLPPRDTSRQEDDAGRIPAATTRADQPGRQSHP